MRLTLACLLASSTALCCYGTTFTFGPSDSDLGDLVHGNAYTWGISATNGAASYDTLKTQLSGSYTITSGTLTISRLYNWNASDTDNQLFIHLLDNPKAGVNSVVDDPNDNGVNQGTISDYFGGKIGGNFVGGAWVAYGYANTAAGALLPTGDVNIPLTQYHDPDGPVTVTNLSYSFTGSQLTTLQTYITNGHTGNSSYADFGLGFDPDCHFYNCGVQLSLTTANGVPDSAGTALCVVLGLIVMSIAWPKFGAARRSSGSS